MIFHFVIHLGLSNNSDEVCIISTLILKVCDASGGEGNSGLVGDPY
jgi:hypothetical protein